MGQIKFVSGIVLTLLFAFTIITFAINFAEDNDSRVTLADDTNIPGIKEDISQNLQVYYSDVNISQEAMQESTISTQTESTEGGTSFKTGSGNLLNATHSVILLPFRKLFMSAPEFRIFFTVLIALLTFIFVLYIWKAWKGDVD